MPAPPAPGPPTPPPRDPADDAAVHDTAQDQRPATDLQLVRLGRHLGLRYDEAESLLELWELAEVKPDPAQRPAGRSPIKPEAALGRFPAGVLATLRSIPGLFLLTNGVTLARLLRGLKRVRSLAAARGRLRAFLSEVESALGSEARLLDQVAHALAESGATTGPRPRRPARRPREGARPRR